MSVAQVWGLERGYKAPAYKSVLSTVEEMAAYGWQPRRFDQMSGAPTQWRQVGVKNRTAWQINRAEDGWRLTRPTDKMKPTRTHGLSVPVYETAGVYPTPTGAAAAMVLIESA